MKDRSLLKKIFGALLVPVLAVSMTATFVLASSGQSFAESDEMNIYSIYLSMNSGEKPDKGDEKEYGDAVLMESDGEYLLMDTGASYVSKSMISYVTKVLPSGKKLDVYISHLHKDHFGGLSDLAKKVDIGTVYLPDKDTIGTEYESSEGSHADIDTILRVYIYSCIDKSRIVWLKRGSGFSVGSVSAEVLGPAGSYKMSQFKNDTYGKKEGHYLNNYSLTTMFTSPSGVRFLTTGDIEEKEEKALVKVHGSSLSADILKLGHHGLKSSSCESFISKVRPVYAFAENMGYDEAVSDDKGNKVQRFNTPAKNVQKYGLLYMVANEKATLGISVRAGRVWLYRDKDNDGTLKESEKLTKWTGLEGIAPLSQKNFTGKDNYYIDANTGKPYKGIRKINGKAYLFSSGGALQKAYYEGTKYRYYRSYGKRLRYFYKPDKSGIASMALGIRKAGGTWFYFENSTGYRFKASKGTGGSQWKVVKIGNYKYAVNIKNGRVFNYKGKKKATIKLGSKKYTADKNGRLK